MWFTKPKKPSSTDITEGYRFSPPDVEKFREASKARPVDDRIPRVYAIAGERARSKGVTLEEFLREDLKRALASNYPTEYCLDVDEIAAVAAGETLPQDRMAHFSECDGCAGAAAGASGGSTLAIDKVWASLQGSVKDANLTEKMDSRRMRSITPVFNEPIFDDDAVTKSSSSFEPPPFLKATH